ncbi:VTT domain-containing protein [Paraflavisolibacter sp. H34]|uniref:TVP38/TMEM64 family protein n=1 Tax=Huijunlia imazamoxiresistens TaxID=3127457 RepID=UPI0030193E76
MKILPLGFSLLFFGLLAGLYFLVPSFQEFSREAFAVLTSENEQEIKSWIGQFGIAGPLVFIGIMIAQLFLLVVPNVLLIMIAIVSFGPVWGSLLSLAGLLASSTVGFLIGRYLGPVSVNKLLSEKTQAKTADFIRSYGVAAIALTRLSGLSNDSLSIVAGLLKMDYKKYIGATLVGFIPLLVLLALFGNNGKILNGLLWIGGISLVLLAVYIIIDKKRKKK